MAEDDKYPTVSSHLRHRSPLTGWDQAQQRFQAGCILLGQSGQPPSSGAVVVLRGLQHAHPGLGRRVSRLLTEHLAQVSARCLILTWSSTTATGAGVTGTWRVRPGAAGRFRLTSSQQDVHVQQMPSGFSALGPHQSSTRDKSLSELLLSTGDGRRGQNVRETSPTELVQPITEQLPGPALQRQDVFGDHVGVYLEGSQEVASAFLRHNGHLKCSLYVYVICFLLLEWISSFKFD